MNGIRANANFIDKVVITLKPPLGAIRPDYCVVPSGERDPVWS